MDPAQEDDSITEHVVDTNDFLDSDDDDDLPVMGSAPSTPKEKRRAQNAIFQSWMTSAAGREVATRRTRDDMPKDGSGDVGSITSLLAQHRKGDDKIVKNPREYQIELFERAKQQNTIAVLDTGSGKTLIAVLLLRHVIDEEIENRSKGHSPKVSFFLVASVTLVFQQFSVLECNLDHKVSRLCGSDNANKDPQRWMKELHENKVIICTSEILFQALSFGYISMKQINLLIFDEAHHTKKNHSYARIIKDFYLDADPTIRPRIFGMTASPIDAKTDVTQAATELETLLNSKIATTNNMSLAKAIKKPTESVLMYQAPPRTGYETALLEAVKARYGDMEIFRTTFERADELARHLGGWCADSFLLHALSHEKAKKIEMEVEKKFVARHIAARVSELDTAIQQVRDAIGFVQKHAGNLKAEISDARMSSKVLQLKGYLELQFEAASNHRCIVFVNRRYTAVVLCRLFQTLRMEHMRPAFLIGHNSASLTEDTTTFKEQVLTLLKFRKGEYNCLFATSVAEEGLDVPDCNLVVRFDMYTTMIQYVQSRGRARNQNSKFIHMIESDNQVQRQLLSDVRHAESAMRKFCDILPEDRRLHGSQDDLELLLLKDRAIETCLDPVSGAKLNYINALTVLATFVSAVPGQGNEPQHPTYVLSARGQHFICEVILPGSSPLPFMIGKVHTRKALAKRSAAFEACKYLRERRYLDEHFAPTYQKKLPAMRNALLAVGMKKMNQYSMQIKPRLWIGQIGSLPKELWITMVDFVQGLDTPHRALAFLTRTPMPEFPAFPVYLNNGESTYVESLAFRIPLAVDDERLAKLSAFTYRVFRDVFSKTYEHNMSRLSYWLAPAQITVSAMRQAQLEKAPTDPASALDWQLLSEMLEHEEYRWTPETPSETLTNKFIVDKLDGSRKFISKSVESHLSPNDPIPAGSAIGKRVGSGRSNSILEYSNSMWKKSRQGATWAPTQPVLKAELMLLRRNMLASPEKKEIGQATTAYICPEPLRISVIPPEVASACLIWPAIIHRFESYLISIEGCDSIGVDCEPRFALAAFTKDSDNQGENADQERINFQRGMGENYERLEFIGDTFLKTATTISTFIRNPDENEFEFHVRRMQMLCNKNLFGTALKLKLYEYIRSMSFNRRYWYPEGMKLLVGTGVIRGQEKEMFHEPREHGLGQKTIADVCEALIGAAFVSHDGQGEWTPEKWDHAVKAVTTFVDSSDHRMLRWQDYSAGYEKPQYQTAGATAVQKDLAQKVELEHAYTFKYPRLLYSAFMHPSVPFSHEKVPSYQRLEFLGDALLDQASITWLFYKYPDKDPQWLTEHKMAMVSNKFLGALCVDIGFHKHLRHYHAALQSLIQAYVTELEEAKAVAGDSRDYWTTVSDPPKCLPDIVEAYIGAMFIDSDFNYGQIQRFFDEHVKWYFADMRLYDTFANSHPCTHLHNMLQTTFGCGDYRLMAREVPAVDGVESADVIAVVMIHDRIMASSVGKSGRYARLRVANQALEKLDGLAPMDFRATYGCGCKVSTGEVLGSSGTYQQAVGQSRDLQADCDA